MFNNQTQNNQTMQPTVSPATEQLRPTVYFYNCVTGLIELMENPTFDVFNNPVAPVGFTACYFNSPMVQQNNNLNLPTMNPIINKSRSNSVEEMTESPKRKFAHRSKQNCINEVYDNIKKFFEPLGVYADGENEVLRGEDTCRVHVKNYAGLKKILEVLQEVYNHEKVTLTRMATCISMKNKFQKKGFICYMKLSNVNQVPIVKDIFAKYSHLYKKCDVAAPKEQVEASIRKNESVNSIDLDTKTITLDGLIPRTMIKKSSVGA